MKYIQEYSLKYFQQLLHHKHEIIDFYHESFQEHTQPQSR